MKAGKVNLNKLTIVMVGPTGQGKSTLGNLIAGGGAGYQPFTTSDDFDSMTIEAAHADFAFDGADHRAIDTIGFLDTRMDATQNMDKFAGFADRAPGGIDAFVFVLKKGRFTEQSLGQISAFRSVAGESAMRHTMLVFTHAGNETQDALSERCHSSTNPHLRSAVESCQQVLGVDSLSPDRCEDDRAAVLKAVKDIISMNHGQKYDNTALTEARKRREELEQQIQGLSAERREAMQDKLDGLFGGRFTFDQVQNAVEEAIEREEKQRREEAERVSMQALLAAAQSEAAAWKEVARNVLMGQRGSGGGTFGACCGPPQAAATFDAGEMRVDQPGPNLGMQPGMNGGQGQMGAFVGGGGYNSPPPSRVS